MRRLAVAAGALLVVAVAGVLVARRSAGEDTAPPDRSRQVTAPGEKSSTQSDRGDDTRRHDPEPARQAAIRAVALTDEVVRAGFISRRELIESFTTPDYGPALAADTARSVNSMLLELGERNVDTSTLAVAERPITATAEPTAAGVRVQVWSVLVIAAPGAGPGRQAWRTVTLDMARLDGRWLVARWSSTPGPTPAPPVEGAFDDASAVVEVLSWPATATSAEGG
jgi:hypothetical protein